MTEISFGHSSMKCTICGEDVGTTGVMTVELSAVKNSEGRMELKSQFFRQCRACTSGRANVTQTTDETGEPVQITTKGYVVINKDFKPSRGLAHELFKLLLGHDGPLSAGEATRLLLEAGIYQQVAPKAAAGNALRPVEVTLKEWAGKKIVERR